MGEGLPGTWPISNIRQSCIVSTLCGSVSPFERHYCSNASDNRCKARIHRWSGGRTP